MERRPTPSFPYLKGLFTPVEIPQEQIALGELPPVRLGSPFTSLEDLFEICKGCLKAGEHFPNASAHHAHQFLQLLEENFKTEHSPANYAKMMYISLPYLREVCQEAFSYRPIHLIAYRLVLETMQLLASTDLRVKEISHRLGFEDPDYFIRFFRKNTGMPPYQFRKEVFRKKP
jgi:AraC-like DNA-binding protein